MSKELEALEKLWNIARNDEFGYNGRTEKQCNEFNNKLLELKNIIEQALQRLKSIDNANPSEALECLEYLYRNSIGYINIVRNKDYNTIKQFLIKAQEQEKVLEIIKVKRIDMWHLVDLLEQDYEMYLAFCKSEKYAKDYILTKEEFELLKRWLNENETR